MKTTALTTFNHGINRSFHLVKVYDLISNTRQKRAWASWKEDFKKIMPPNWKKSDEIFRIDGKDNNSVLVVKTESGLTRENFNHEYASELLRAAIVLAVSSIDTYFHNIIVDNALKILAQPEEKIPKTFMKISIPIVEVDKALKKQRKNSVSRPGHKIKAEVQKYLTDATFQSPTSIESAMNILGISSIWTKIVNEIDNGMKGADIRKKLGEIVYRRNKIVHHADIIKQTKARNVKMESISRDKTFNDVEYMRTIIETIDKIVSDDI